MPRYAWRPKEWRLQQNIEEKKKELAWWQYPIDFLARGTEQAFTAAGAILTAPFRPRPEKPMGLWQKIPPLGITRFYPGAAEYEAYKEWKGTAAEPEIELPIPSWRQMGTWIGEAYPPSFLAAEEPVPEGEFERAKMGMAETAELAPLFMIPGGKGGKDLTALVQKAASKYIKKGMPEAKAINRAYQELAKKGKLPKYRVPKTVEEATEAVAKREGIGEKKILPRVIEPEAVATNLQKTEAHSIARSKLLINEAGKMRPQYRRLAQAITGKRTMKDMTQGEADYFIEALKGLEVKAGKVPKIPVTTGIITKEFADKIPLLNEIGLLERVRPTRQVFEKMGLRREVWEPAFEAEIKIYEDLMKFRGEIRGIEGLVGRSPESRSAIFKALENPAEVKLLGENEKRAYDWFRKYFDKWADDLKLPADKRRKNYVTHIFEKAIAQDLEAKRPLDPELIRALDFMTPKRVFNPYLEKRLGQRLGLREDPFSAAEAYEAKALKVYHYEPLIKRIRTYEKYLPPLSARYLRDFVTRITGRPLTIDREINQTMKEFAKAIEWLPGGKALGSRLSQNNFGGLLAYQYSSLLYFLWLGFKPTSAIRNLSQHSLILGETGALNLARGIGLRGTQEGKQVLKECLVLRSRSQALLPGIDTSFASRWTDAIREKALWMFRKADRQNVSDAFLAGYVEAKRLGLPRPWCIKRGDEVAADTQYIYTRLGGASWSQSALGRALSPLTTWPENWLELMSRWIGSKPSYVFRDYEAATGIKIAREMNWLLRKKALMIYLSLVGTAYAVENTTNIKATQYTGWTSLRYLVDMARGKLPALDLPGAAAMVAGGAVLGDKTLIKQGWNRLRPDKIMGIVRQIDNVAQGKTDWLSLFVYKNPEDEMPLLPAPWRSRSKYKLPTQEGAITFSRTSGGWKWSKGWVEEVEKGDTCPECEEGEVKSSYAGLECDKCGAQWDSMGRRIEK